MAELGAERHSKETVGVQGLFSSVCSGEALVVPTQEQGENFPARLGNGLQESRPAWL